MPRVPSLKDKNEPTGSFVKLTSRGWGLLALSGIGVIVGFLLPEPRALQIGLLGILLVAIARPFAKWNVRGLELARNAPDSAFAGQLFPLEVKLKNPRRKLDAIAIECEDLAAGPAEKGLHAAWVKPGGTASRKVETRLLRRGVSHRLRSLIESTFPFGLWRARLEIRDVLEMAIYPRAIVPKILEDPEFVSLLEADDAESLRFDLQGDFHGLREFQPGDRLKHIDWPATARSGKIMVRQYDKRLPSRFLVVFHSIAAKPKAGHGEAFESAMEMLCGLVMHSHDRQIPVDLVASFNNWKTLSIDGSEVSLHAGLRMLAAARRSSDTDFSPLQRALVGVDSSQRVFILSDIPVKDWEASLPELPCLTTCLSVSDLRVRRPLVYKKFAGSAQPVGVGA